MAVGMDALLGNYYSPTSYVNGTSQIFDYKAAQKEAQGLLDDFKASSSTVKSLSKESADFLKTYTSGMNAQFSAASKLTNGGIDKLLYGADGKVTDETVKKTVDAVKDMITTYNDNVKMLGNNTDRGAGVSKQLARMVDNPAAQKSMEMVGVSVNKDGTLALDAEKMTAALKSENPNQVRLYKELIGDSTGIAGGIRKDAQAGLNTSAASLIGNDVAKMQAAQNENSFASMLKELRGGGAYALNNQAAIGIMMNMLV